MTSVDNARPSRKWSILGWSAAAGIGILTSYLLILLTAFAFLVIPFLLLPILFRYLPLQLCLLIVIFGLVIAVGMLRALIPRRDKSQVIGLPLDLAAQPRLHAEITRIAGVLRQRCRRKSISYLAPTPSLHSTEEFSASAAAA